MSFKFMDREKDDANNAVPNRVFLRTMAFVVLSQVMIVIFVVSQSHSDSKALVHSLRDTCKRENLDRQDNAAFQRAHTTYITKVTKADSVKEDVKRAARTARKVFDKSASDLEERARINCDKSIKDASWLP